MSNIRKLSAFRQLSLNCNSTPEHRRKTLKKQFSEDLPDYRGDWLDPIKISLSSKSGRNFDRPPSIKIAWEENSELKAEEAVIIKRCKEVRRASTGKLSRQNSLDKDSILHSKQEITERLRQHVKDHKEKDQEKTNLKIFLAQNSVDQTDAFYNAQIEKEPPKLIQPLITNNARHTNTKNPFKIHRNRRRIDLHEIAYSPTRSKDAISRNSPLLAPMTDKDHADTFNLGEEIKPIDSIIIRPTTAASKREKFQRRSNSAFVSAVDSPARPPLVRAASAAARPQHGKSKFVATKRKIRSAKRPAKREDDLEGSVAGEEGAIAINGAEVVTMVSLVSPAGSDAEEEVTNEGKEKGKGKKDGGKAKEEAEVQRNMSLRKTVKSVSFQQSSIHAVRSFSASFPARRGSMATVIMLGNNAKTSLQASKVQEKRSTNSSAAHDEDERGPKRRLLRSGTDSKIDSCDPPEESSPQLTDEEEKPSSNVNFTVDIKTKDVHDVPKSPDIDNVLDGGTPVEAPAEPKQEVKYESPKEKQCLELYQKMIEKGINVSLDTILRGMLTPTEYRLSRQNSVPVEVEEEGTEDAAS